MGTTLNRKAYARLIEENIAEIEKYMPDSLERQHTIEVLRWSVVLEYGRKCVNCENITSDKKVSYCDECLLKDDNNLK